VTEDELTQFEALAKAATPGPWETRRDGEVFLQTERDGRHWVGNIYNDSDQRFVAAARDAVPALVAKVRRLRATQCSVCGGRLYFSCRARGDGLCSPCHREATGTQTEVDRVRGDLECAVKEARRAEKSLDAEVASLRAEVERMNSAYQQLDQAYVRLAVATGQAVVTYDGSSSGGKAGGSP
jgi:uncharacterized Zn finger protein (UPF0148 family)